MASWFCTFKTLIYWVKSQLKEIFIRISVYLVFFKYFKCSRMFPCQLLDFAHTIYPAGIKKKKRMGMKASVVADKTIFQLRIKGAERSPEPSEVLLMEPFNKCQIFFDV